MTKQRKRQFRVVPRRFGLYSPSRWTLSLDISEVFYGSIHFWAAGGGNAKQKALQKIQRVLAAEMKECQGNPRVSAVLWNNGTDVCAPTYVIRKWYSNSRKIMATRSSSRAFRVKEGHH